MLVKTTAPDPFGKVAPYHRFKCIVGITLYLLRNWSVSPGE